LGEALLKQQEKLFELWHRVRDGTLTRCELLVAVNPIRAQIKALLQEAADYEIASQEKTPLAKTVRTCRQLLKVEPAMWLFVTVEGVEPTNNAAERAIRPAVLWRRTSFGTSSPSRKSFCGSDANSGNHPADSKAECSGVHDDGNSCCACWSIPSLFAPRSSYF
jgi:hypothetical protein